MGATRESNWSGGILAAWSCARGAGVQAVGGMYANAFPGTIANEQTITSTSRKVALKNFGFGFTAVFGRVAFSPMIRSNKHAHARQFATTCTSAFAG